MQLFFIILAGFLFRLAGINKLEGLWNDEYVSWQIAATSFQDGFIPAMKAQCHMPFYYFYLKLCMAWGGQSDLWLRFTSLIPGVLSIIVMYFVGLQKDKKTALTAALLTAISSFLIYYSQEVRLYSLLFLFSAISLLYMLRFLKNKTVTNLGGLILFDFLILFTHTIGFVFVFFQILFLSILVFKEYKKQILALWLSLIALGAILAPFAIQIFKAKVFVQWWGHFTPSKIGFLFTDYFSPVLTNLTGAPDNLFYVKSLSFVFFTFITPLIAIFLIGKSVYKNKQNLFLLLITICTVAILVAAAVMGKLVFVTKYSIEIYPILLFLAAYGMADFEKKYIGNILLTIFCFINLFYLIISPTSAPKMPRPEGHKLVADLINNAKLNDGDFILMEYYGPDRFGKYIDFDKYNIVVINKGNFPEYISNDYDYSKIYENGKELYKPIFNQSQGYIDYKLKSDIIDKLKQNQSVLVISDKQVSVYSQQNMNNILSDDSNYKKVPIMFLVFSYINNHTTNYLTNQLTISRVEQKGSWQAIKFIKLNK